MCIHSICWNESFFWQDIFYDVHKLLKAFNKHYMDVINLTASTVWWWKPLDNLNKLGHQSWKLSCLPQVSCLHTITIFACIIVESNHVPVHLVHLPFSVQPHDWCDVSTSHFWDTKIVSFYHSCSWRLFWVIQKSSLPYDLVLDHHNKSSQSCLAINPTAS